MPQPRLKQAASFLVIVPTHDHQDTLLAALASIRQQSLDAFRVVVIGDGAPPRVGQLVAEFAGDDPRFAYIDRPKSPRTGEPYRDEVIREAEEPLVAYLADDDLWYPDHLAQAQAALQQADFCHGMNYNVLDDGRVTAIPASMASAPLRQAYAERRLPSFSLCNASHRRDAYLALPHGWRTTPAGYATDQHMWQVFAEDSRIRCVTLEEPQALHFPDQVFGRLPAAERRRHLEHWLARMQPGQRRQLAADADFMMAIREHFDGHGNTLEHWLAQWGLDQPASGLALTDTQRAWLALQFRQASPDITSLESLLQQHPDCHSARIQLLLALAGAGQNPQRQRQLAAQLEAQRTPVHAMKQAIDLLLKKDQSQDLSLALAQAQAMAEAHPFAQASWLALSQAQSAAGLHAEALASARQAQAMAGDSPWVWMQLGLCLEQEAQPDESMAWLARAAGALPERPWPALSLGRVCRQAGQPQLAREALKRALQANPGHAGLKAELERCSRA